MIESKSKSNIPTTVNSKDCIFIVGMPRSGSTLLESIISMNNEVIDLGETNLFEKSFVEWKTLIGHKSSHLSSLNQIYCDSLLDLIGEDKITTNKCLYNYQYCGVIAKKIPRAVIINCFRNFNASSLHVASNF